MSSQLFFKFGAGPQIRGHKPATGRIRSKAVSQRSRDRAATNKQEIDLGPRGTIRDLSQIALYLLKREPCEVRALHDQRLSARDVTDDVPTLIAADLPVPRDIGGQVTTQEKRKAQAFELLTAKVLEVHAMGLSLHQRRIMPRSSWVGAATARWERTAATVRRAARRLRASRLQRQVALA